MSAGSVLDAGDEQLVRLLAERPEGQGISLADEAGLLAQLTTLVLEALGVRFRRPPTLLHRRLARTGSLLGAAALVAIGRRMITGRMGPPGTQKQEGTN